MTASALTIPELAERERVSVGTVRWWVSQRKAPPSYKIGRRRLFDLDAVIAWELARKAETAR